MSYDELCKSLGIDREAIRKAAKVETNPAIGKEPGNPKLIGERLRRPPGEDLSHLTSDHGRRVSRNLRKKNHA